MDEQERHQIIADYLRRLSEALAEVPNSARRELVEDVRDHIEEAWHSAPERNRAALLNILERLGEPEDLAREERERLGIRPAARDGEHEVLSWAAVVFTVAFWPIGVVLSWFSSRWTVGDKAIATLLPVLGLFLGMFLNMAVYTTAAQTVVHNVPVGVEQAAPGMAPETAPPALPPDRVRDWRATIGTTLAFYGFLGAPLTSAAYLALRLWRGTRGGRTLAPVLVGTFLLGTLLLVLVLPAYTTPSTTQVVPRPASSSTEQVH